MYPVEDREPRPLTYLYEILQACIMGSPEIAIKYIYGQDSDLSVSFLIWQFERYLNKDKPKIYEDW